ncbi:MAG: pyruvate, phosphate dikinase [Deltaproteobacteria bacterium]|jgi:pyruvate,orthophosphate dikinase|nr:pyruvate, phosphate dikinase [Deltaproteobacteria bacterium]
MANAKRWVYLFTDVKEAESYVNEDWEKVRGLLGGKGANLAEMTRLGLPVPPGFTVTTEGCNAYSAAGAFPEGMWEQMLEALGVLTQQTGGKKLGDPKNPLLVSCRSGAKFSMPGMMDTVLNVGLNDETAEGMVQLTKNPRFVYDSYRRLVEMFGTVVFEIPDEAFHDYLKEYKGQKGYKSDTEMSADDWKVILAYYKDVVKKHKNFDFPQDPYQQVKLVSEAVFKSWNGKRAIDYRRATNIPDDLGTAVNIVTMVFGNMGDDSGTGVVFTRNPATGENVLYGDYLLNAQGEDVVAGIRNTSKIANLIKELPESAKQLDEIIKKLEKHFKDMQDVEFTIERNRLYMLQTRNGKRTSQAAVRVAVDMVDEGLISKEEALRRVRPEDIDALLHPQFDLEEKKKAQANGSLLAKGVNASPGAAVGQIYFSADKAEQMAKEHKQKVIMVRPFTKPDDVHGMLAAEGVLTSEGGATSHAAVVARQFGVCCVVGAEAIKIDLEKKTMTAGGKTLKEGDWISVDGNTGEVFVRPIPTKVPDFDKQGDLLTLLNWADEISASNVRSGENNTPKCGLMVWANADSPLDAKRARAYGAKGIGLCRTEHMFFAPERLPIVQKMILAKTSAERIAALDELLPFQRNDFTGLFEEMDGLAVIIRLIDPPLHEFLPHLEKLIEEVATLKAKGETKGLIEKEAMLANAKRLHEQNPMMGLRGVRLSIVMPEIVQMQVKAIFEAAADCAKKGIKVFPEIMIPLTGHVNELKVIQPKLEDIASAVMKTKGVKFAYKFGSMIEIPRAALTAGEIASLAEFFSFGTNDLTQMTFGYSRDDAEASFLLEYVERGILPKNPFQTLDNDGVGRLIRLAAVEGHKVRPELEVGICGEHGGDPESIKLCFDAGLNYVSCSPFRVPVARLAAAHAALK